MSDLVGNPEDRFSHNEAHLRFSYSLMLQTCIFHRGALKYHIKAYELAIRDLSKAASIDSSCALAYFNRAVCYQENKDYQKVSKIIIWKAQGVPQ